MELSVPKGPEECSWEGVVPDGLDTVPKTVPKSGRTLPAAPARRWPLPPDEGRLEDSLVDGEESLFDDSSPGGGPEKQNTGCTFFFFQLIQSRYLSMAPADYCEYFSNINIMTKKRRWRLTRGDRQVSR